MDYETLDWMDAFDDSVFTDTIEANDTSALTGFDNTETSSPLEANETETASTLEADETNTEDVTPINDDFFKYFTPTISRAAKPSTDDGPAPGSTDNDDDGPTPGSTPKDDKPTPGSTDDDDPDISLDDYYGGGKTDGDDDDDDDYGSWTDKDRSDFAKEIAEKAGKESEAAASELESIRQHKEDVVKDHQKKAAAANEARAKLEAAINGLNTGVGVGTEESKKAHESMYAVAITKGKDSAQYKKYAAEAAEIDKKELERLQAVVDKADKDAAQALSKVRSVEIAEYQAKTKAQEALERAQAAKDKAGTLSAEALEATKRAEEKQKEWEQKQAEAKATEAAKATEIAGKPESGSSTSTDTNSATNNPVTFDLAKTLADSGAKMTEEEYGQVADFVAAHPELASIINGGLTNAEKHTIGNVIAGIQAINAGNYLTAVKEFAQGFGMSLVSAVQLISTGIYGAGARIAGIIKSFMENPNIEYVSHNKDFETFEKMRAEYGDSSELQALYDTAKGTTEQKQTFDYMKDNAATSVGEYNEGLVEDVNKVVSDASRKVIHYSPYVLEAVKKWRK